MHIHAAVGLWESCQTKPVVSTGPPKHNKGSKLFKKIKFCSFLSGQDCKNILDCMKLIWFHRDSVRAVRSTCCNKLLGICIWMVAKWSKRPQIWTCPDFANCLGQMKISLHWWQYSFKILTNPTRQILISCGLNWQYCRTRGWHFSLLLV